MRSIVIDPFHGAAGDMIVGALLACGAEETHVRRAMRSVVGEPSITIVDRAGIRAIKVDTHAPICHRTFEEVRIRVQKAELSDYARSLAMRIFERVNEAEKAVHGAETVFHEVGADDAIADVIGACTALESLRVEGISIRPIALGQGTIQAVHGRYPVPAPATLALLSGSSLEVAVNGGEEGELCTPTGAAILAEFRATLPSCPEKGTVLAVGYGAGDSNPPGVPNVLRATLIEGNPRISHDRVDILETNVDDISGEVLSSTLTRLMKEGARDASALPCIMKKGRAGYLVRVICRPGDGELLSLVMAEELGTLGVRCMPVVHRFVAERRSVRVTIEVGGKQCEIPVKCGIIGGRCYTMKAEFDAARACAEAMGIPVRDVIRIAEEQAWRDIERSVERR
jgi:uncharacterized protein (TIGR00299 family) protein